ncbi:hypothetical protein [Amycolatopsis sp. NPDC054798]
MSLIKLNGIVRDHSTGFELHQTFKNDTRAVVAPRPFMEIDGKTALFPSVELNDNGNLVIRLDRWSVGSLDVDRCAVLRLYTDQPTALRVAQEFADDPGISWDSAKEDLDLWCLAWIERHNREATEPRSEQ